MRNILKKVPSSKSLVPSECKYFRLGTRDSGLGTDSGYTLLFAMIVASIVLALGVSILTISRKEFALSSSATQSTNSFYAADSGIGCAEYWDNSSSVNFSTSSPDNLTSTSITCSYNDTTAHTVTLSGPFPPTYPDELPNSSTYTFTFYPPFSTDGTSNKSCAAVTVDKYYVIDPSLGLYIRTAINSSGYNIGYNATNPVNSGVPDCSSPSPKKLERAIQVTY